MAPAEPEFGPLQLLVVRFETTERLHGEIARELHELRGRGLIRVLDARFLSRSADGELTEMDLNPLLGEPAVGAGVRPLTSSGSTAGPRAPPTGGDRKTGSRRRSSARRSGFTLEDLRRLTDEIGPGEHAAVVLVEHRWAAAPAREDPRRRGRGSSPRGCSLPRSS